MKNKYYLLIPLIATLLTSCGGSKSITVDVYKDLRQVNIGGLVFDFGLPAAASSSSEGGPQIYVTFTVTNTTSKQFELTFTTKPYLIEVSTGTIYQPQHNSSTVPETYVFESGESQKYGYKTTLTGYGLMIEGFPLDLFLFSFVYNDKNTVNYHLCDKPNE